jgi:hypothetical protein
MFFLSTIVGFAIISCSKDNSLPSHKNYFSVGDSAVITLIKGYLLDHGQHGVTGDPSVRHMHADFISTGLDFDPATETFTGKGNRVSIAFFTNADGEIPTGRYEFDSDGTNVPFTFSEGFVWENHNSVTGTGDVHSFTDGTILVSKGRDFDYDITWNVDLSNGKRAVGTYKGVLFYRDVEK